MNQNSEVHVTVCTLGLFTYHHQVPHSGRLGHCRGDDAAGRQHDDLDGLVVQQIVEDVGAQPWVALQENERTTDVGQRLG